MQTVQRSNRGNNKIPPLIHLIYQNLILAYSISWFYRLIEHLNRGTLIPRSCTRSFRLFTVTTSWTFLKREWKCNKMNEIEKKNNHKLLSANFLITHRKNTDKKLSTHYRKKLYLKLKARLINQTSATIFLSPVSLRHREVTTEERNYLCMNSVWLSVLKCFQFGMSSWAECLFLKELMNQSSH